MLVHPLENKIMGDITDLIMDGIICEQCGEMLIDIEDGEEALGVPGHCSCCDGEVDEDDET